MFATHGLPRTLVTDNGAQFTSSEFELFLSNNGIRYVKTSPYHPASNGLAERAVQVFKETMKKLPSSDSIETRLSKFLFWYRLTPHSTTGVPPSELLLGRVPRSLLDLLKPSLSTKVRQKQEVQKFNHDGPSRDRKFHVGDAVYVKEFPSGKVWVPAVVSSVRGPLSYHVSLSDGRVVRRHVEHIRIRTCDSSDQNTESDIEIPTVEMSESSTVTESSAPEPQADNPPSQPTRRSGRASRPPDYYHSTV